jgi:ABC-type dipeptide/oligopeptide/nickel transport system permease subunit
VNSDQGTYKKAWERFGRNRPAKAAVWFVGLAFFTAIFGYWLAPDGSTNANTQIAEIALRPPGHRATLVGIPLESNAPAAGFFTRLWQGQTPSMRWVAAQEAGFVQRQDSIFFQRIGGKSQEAVAAAGARVEQRTFWLGTDKYGRCTWSRLMLGFRVSLLVGGIAVVISLSIGLLLGLLGGYLGGRTDDAVMLLVNTVWSIPTLLLVFAIVLALGRGIGIIFLAVGLTMWVDVARVVRGQAIALRDQPFVEAAKSMGMGHGRILWQHILPNLLGPVMVVAAGNFATAILVESGLSYLGFGVQPPAPSWGSMLHENYGYALGGKPLLALAPALAIALTVLAFNLIGNGMRDALDVKN